MDFLRKAVLPFVVFVTGACVLILEITATRVLSPYYGNTIYTVSSVIGIILAALSVGYYAGGKLADRRSTEAWFYGIILAGGLSVFLLYGIAKNIKTKLPRPLYHYLNILKMTARKFYKK